MSQTSSSGIGAYKAHSVNRRFVQFFNKGLLIYFDLFDLFRIYQGCNIALLLPRQNNNLEKDIPLLMQSSSK